MKKVIIRTDASFQIGSGHVMRCLTVAHNLQKQGYEVFFWMERLPGNLIDFVEQQGFQNIKEAENADLYIIDHYEIDAEWESKIRSFAPNIIVIDDLADRIHDCDLLLDQNVVPDFGVRYDSLVPEHCIKLLGPKYLMMRDEFIEARANLRERDGQVKRLLVFMGGTDPTNETMKVLQALQSLTFPHIDIVVGNGNVHKEEIQKICLARGYDYHCQIDYMAQLMHQADFCIGAGGATTWERCYVGLPSSSTIVADNQKITTEFSAELGAVINLGWHEDVTAFTYKQLVQKVSEINKKQLQQIGLRLTATEESNAWLSKIMELI